MTLWLLVVLVTLSALFSATEIAFFSLSDARLRSLAESKKASLARQAKRVLKLKEKPQKLLATMIVGDSIVDIASASIATALAIEWFGSIGIGIATGMMTLIILVVGEIIPKAIAQQHPDRFARAVAPLTAVLVFVLTPLTYVFELLIHLVNKLTGGNNAKGISKEEVKAMVYMGAEAGSVAMEEQEMIENIFTLDQVTAEGIMTQTTDVVALNISQPAEELVHIMTETGFSRFPVYNGNIDNIVGIIYSKDVMEEVMEHDGRHKHMDLKPLLRPVIFVPEEKKVIALLRDFQQQHKHIAVVVNEFGETRGIITLEDVLEEIVGEITDEQDQISGRIKRLNPKTIIADADVTIEEIERFIDKRLHEDDHKTIAWVILKELGRVPAKGDELTLNHTKVIIEEAEEQKIKRVKLIKIR